jgi:hypothetical protein
MSDSQRKSTFSLNLKSEKVIDFLESDSVRAGVSKTSYLNTLLSEMADLRVTLSEGGSSMLDEISALKELYDDRVMRWIPEMAAENRRKPVQMALHLMEKGIEVDKPPQLAAFESPNAEGRIASLKRQEKNAAA